MIEIVIYTIYDMSAKLSSQNVEKINKATELNFEDTKNVTYQMLIDQRSETMGMAYGYPRHKNEKLVWILPSLPMGLIIDSNNTDIKEYTEGEYIEYEKTLDPLPFDNL